MKRREFPASEIDWEDDRGVKDFEEWQRKRKNYKKDL